jgi:Mn-dependent DtxR family transcriptional regulator
VLYAPAFYVVTNSLSVQSLILLLNRGGSLTRADLAHRFASRELLEARLKTLARSGYVVMDEAGVRISRRGRCLVATLLALKSLWRLGSGG